MAEAAIIPQEPGTALAPHVEDLGLELSLRARIIVVVAAVVIALVSAFPVADFAASPETHTGTIASLDVKKDNVMGLIAASTAISAAVTLLPDDTGTPIAEKLVDISSDFLIVLVAIYLEKYLLTIFGLATFRVLIPVACAMVVGGVLLQRRAVLQSSLLRLAAKLTLLGVALIAVVPVSVGIAGMIEDTYQESIDATMAVAADTTEQIEEAAAADEAETTEESGGFLGFITKLPDTISQIPTAVSDATVQAQEAVGNFIEALAVMIVTSCVIPILVLAFMLWLVQMVLGINVNVPMNRLRPRTFTRSAKKA